MTATSIIYKANDNLLKLLSLKKASDGSYINSGASVQVTLKNSAGSDVSGQTWPTSMTYVAASNGDYTAVLEDELVLTEEETYDAIITVDAGSGLKAEFTLKVTAKIRVRL